jgi:Tfp pilus assembly protein PilF
MGRSLYRADPHTAAADFTNRHELANRISGRHYSMLLRAGSLFERRVEIGFDGRETNIVEQKIDYVVGSGNHARTYLHRTAQGTLIELPVSWYSENGGYWAMSPGFDRPNQPDFLRTVSTDCMFCHNGYPDPAQRPVSAAVDPVFGPNLPEGIDCQRCHGPGRAHVAAASSRNAPAEALRKAIVNPAKLSRQRQLEVCLQCHLETTSRDLPAAIPHYDHPPFAYRPGEPLGDYISYFDHAPGAGRDDKFEIAHAAYRLRKSQCFLKSQMTCTTCHDPHRIPRGEEATQHYVAVCKNCHAAAHSSVKLAQSNCVECHMPKRRAEDAVHTVLTDHYIQRRLPARNLTAPLEESDFRKYDIYRGRVIPYYPSSGYAPHDDLYLAVAQVENQSNLSEGIPVLEQQIRKLEPAEPEFYFELAQAYSHAGNGQQAERSYRDALRHKSSFRPAIHDLTLILVRGGRLQEAATLLESAASAVPPDLLLITDLGTVYWKQGNLDRAEQLFRQVLAADPDSPDAANLLGSVLTVKGALADAEAQFRRALALAPDLAEGHFNLANLLARQEKYPESAYHFQRAIAVQPDYAEAHHNYGNLLTLMHSLNQAHSELEIAIRLAPNLANTHRDLADELVLEGRTDQGIEEYRRAIQLDPNLFDAHLGLGLSLLRKGNSAEARVHFSKAAESPDTGVRQMALKALAH